MLGFLTGMLQKKKKIKKNARAHFPAPNCMATAFVCPVVPRRDMSILKTGGSVFLAQRFRTVRTAEGATFEDTTARKPSGQGRRVWFEGVWTGLQRIGR